VKLAAAHTHTHTHTHTHAMLGMWARRSNKKPDASQKLVRGAGGWRSVWVDPCEYVGNVWSRLTKTNTHYCTHSKRQYSVCCQPSSWRLQVSMMLLNAAIHMPWT
jgi:hypothetical protein